MAPTCQATITRLLIIPCLSTKSKVDDTTIRVQSVHGNRNTAHTFLGNYPREVAGGLTAPFEPPRRRLRASPQPGNPLSNAIHHSMSARLEETQLPHHRVVLWQVARENDIACGAIHLPELPQASGRGTAEACFVSRAFMEAAGSVATSAAAI